MENIQGRRFMFSFSRSRRAISAKLAVLALAIALITPAVQAQFSDSYKFLKAVKDAKGSDATRIIDEPGSGAVIINTRDSVSGEGALHIVVKRRDTKWIRFLLQKGADPDIADKKRATPLILATQLNFQDGVEWLLKYSANVDKANRSGETPLILAVQLRNKELVRMLLKKGANPDKTDSIAGLSARDYATRDRRAKEILTLIESRGESDGTEPTDQGDLDFSGIGEAQ